MELPSKLMNRNFFLLWQGQLVSQVGSQAFAIAMMFWIKHATGSATLMGMLMMVSMLPAVILGPIGGTFADRFSRRTIIILGDILNGIAVLSLAGLIFIAPDSVEFILVWLFVVAIIVAVVGSFFRPAISAAIPDLVPEAKVAGANSLNQSSLQISMLVGQGFGGVLYRLLGAPVLFLIDGLTYLFSAASESFITIPQVIPEKNLKWRESFREFKSDTIQGFRFVWKNAGLRQLFYVAAFLNFFAMPFIVLFPFYVEDFLHAKPDWYGFLWASFGFGSLIGYLFAGAIKLSGKTRSRFVVASLAIFSLEFGALGIVNVPIVSLVLVLTAGVFNGFLNINIITMLQITTPGEIRGRVFGLLTTLAMGLSPISIGLSGVVADLTGQNIPLIYVTCGGIMVLLSVMLSLSRDFRAFMAYVHKGED